MPKNDILFPARGFTKRDLELYYERVAKAMIRHARGRPLSLQRAPRGLEGKVFYQQHAPTTVPDGVHRVSVAKKDGEVNHLLCDNLTSVRFLAKLRSVGVHCWTSKLPELSLPDLMVFDLDPSGQDHLVEFIKVKDVAMGLKELLEQASLRPFVKTTGSRGLHVVVPIRPEFEFSMVRAIARSLALEVVQRMPQQATVAFRKSKRGGRIFVDVLRNAWGQTMVAPYSPRARPEASVSMPIHWEELQQLSSARSFDIQNVPHRLSYEGDCWSGLARHRRSVRHLSEALN